MSLRATRAEIVLRGQDGESSTVDGPARRAFPLKAVVAQLPSDSLLFDHPLVAGRAVCIPLFHLATRKHSKCLTCC